MPIAKPSATLPSPAAGIGARGALAVAGPEEGAAALGDALCAVAAELGAQGLCQGTGGNFSVVVRRRPLELLITPSGRDKRSLTAADLLLVGADGRSSVAGGRRPSAEAPLHAAIAESTGAGAVLHTHSVSATLLGDHYRPPGGFTLRGFEMLKGLAGIRSHEEEVWVPVLPNSQDMARLRTEVEGLLRARPGLHGLLLAGHGLYTWGGDLFEARRQVEIYEFLFECVARRTSFEPYAG